MPSSTDLPTPEPANRPMRCPPPTDSSALIERTPTSSGSRIARRISGIERLVRSATRDRCSARSPRPSSGGPAPSRTRPSSSSPTATVMTLRVGMTRAPGMRPRMSPVGIRNSLSPENPTTSASICLPSAVSIRQRPPTAASQPTASRVMPTMRLSVPSTTNSAVFAMRSRALHQRLRPSLGPRAPEPRRLAHAPPPRGFGAWRSVPMSSLRIAPRRVSRRASTREVAVVIWQPPRAMTGSSTISQARSFSVGARF